MKRWLKYSLGGLLLIVVAGGATVVVAEKRAVQRAQRHVDVTMAAVPFRTDPGAVARGRHLFNSRGCTDCHGADGGGRTLVNDGKGTHLAGHNLTSGNPRLAAYKEVDWVRSIRHGVGPEGRPLRLMPSEDYNRMSDDDFSAIVAYVRQLPPVPGRLQPFIELPLPARVLYGLDVLHDASEKINHRLPPAQPVAEAASPDYGRYVAQMCQGCHGATLSGGKIPGGPPDWPPASRLSSGEGSAMPRYADAAAFMRMFKTGKRPDGTAIRVMPFGSLGQMNDTELAALFMYLKSL